MSPASGSLDRRLLEAWPLVGGVDEVGRGALAGPLAVGLVVTDGSEPPEGLKDSKDLTPRARLDLVDPIEAWAVASAVGWVGPTFISDCGVTAALREATLNALDQVHETLKGLGRSDLGVMIIDGNYDWMRVDPPDLFDQDPPDPRTTAVPKVVTQVKADRLSPAVAAASVIAKVARDQHMESLGDPGYSWKANKGYATAAHIRGLTRLGASDEHRRGWRLPGLK